MADPRPLVNALLALRPLLLVGFVVLIGWLVSRLVRGRLGDAGKMLLLAISVAFFYFWAWAIAFQNLGQPLRILWWVVLVGGTLLLVRLLLRLFPFPAPWWFGPFLASPARGLLLPADLVLDRMALGPGMKVVEVGPGMGFLSFPAAKRLEPGGTLYCVDIQQEMIDGLLARADARKAGNIEGIVAPAEELPDAIYDADLVFFVTVLGEVKDKKAALAEALRVLKPGGVLSVTEFVIDPHSLSRGEVQKLAEQAGFEPSEFVGNLWSYTGTFRKPGQYDWRKS